MTDKSRSDPPKDNPWIISPPGVRDAVSLGINFDATARDLTPDFVKQLTAVVRSVQGIDDLTIGGGGDTEGRCGVLGQCGVNRDRCPVLQFCGTNA